MSQERVDKLFASESWTAVYTAFTQVSLQAYDFDSIRETLLGYINATYPEKFNDFIASSEFIAILDLVAYLGHSLAFRNDMNTRENFMDTAERRESILRMAKTLGYIKTRPINAKGLMKITSISTTEDVADNEGNSLAGTVVNWNDGNDVDWYEKFITVLNASFNKNTKIQDPSATLNISGVENYLYEINENLDSKSIAYAFTSPIAGSERRFEAVRTVIENDKIVEGEPLESKNFTILNRNDNLGPASDRTGFFVTAKAGQLQFENFKYSLELSNRVEEIDNIDISNSDVWVHKLDTGLSYESTVTKVDNETRETAIYNSLRTGDGNLVHVTTNENNSIQLRYPDGIFGNAAFGDYRVWYRTVANENFTVNSGDIDDVTISIPYIGADDQPYRLSLTLASTRDFAENFAGETFASVRRISQRAYYAQDRMVNAQDYNIYPLTLGNNVVSKVKAVNTSFAGLSRFFEMDDVLGHHSNLAVTGTDGSIFMEDETTIMSLRFNRNSGNSDDFIRNELIKAIKHPALMNLFYTKYQNSTSVNVVENKTYVKHETNNLQLTFTVPIECEVGDFVKIQGDSGTEYYAKVMRVVSTDPGSIILDKVITENGTLKTTIKGYRTKFRNDTGYEEITNIKTKVDDLSQTSFTLHYSLQPNSTSKWMWKVWDGVENISDKVKVSFTYNPGIRQNEAEYSASVVGKRVVFESYDQVKFYYGNKEMVVDNETNLAERDKILINYYDGGSVSTSPDTLSSDEITVGYAPVSNYQDDGSGGATFDAVYQYTGAEVTYDFVENNPVVQSSEYQHYLVSPAGIEYELEESEIIAPASPNHIIGETPAYTLNLAVADITKYVSSTTDIAIDESVGTSNEIYVAGDQIPIITETDAANVANSAASFSTVSNSDITGTYSFKGKPSTTYFGSAPATGNFFWTDASELPSGQTASTASVGMTGVVTDFITQFNGATNQWTFTYPNNSGLTSADNTENDVRFKQTAYGEITFNNSSGVTLTSTNMLLYDNNNNIIDKEHTELVDLGSNNFKVIFWTIDPGISSLIDVKVGDGSQTTSLGEFAVKVVANCNIAKQVQTQTATYKTKAAFVYDDYTTGTGYLNHARVKLLTLDTDSNPYGILEIFKTTTDTSRYVVESYINTNNIALERASKIATAGPNVGTTTNPIPEGTRPEYQLWYNTDNGDWYSYVAGQWTTSFTYSVVEPGCIYVGDIKYKVVDGKSFTEDKFMSYRWDHYADLDKRIDPSTSNIVDIYVLTSDYVRRVNKWVAGGFKEEVPIAPNNFELKSMMNSIEPKSAIADHISYIPVTFKYLFGSFAKPENQAVFKVVKKSGTAYTDSEIKTAVSAKVNEYFDLDNWNFGDTFYFSELASYLHQQLGDYIASVIITPKFSTSGFTDLLSITSDPNEIFLSVTSSSDVKVISAISQTELQGEDVTTYGQ